MLQFYKKYWRTIFDIGMIALTVFLIMFAFSYLYKIAAPIFLAFIIFFFIEPFARFLNKRRIKKSIATAISLVLFILVILGALSTGVVVFVGQVSNLTDRLPEYSIIMQDQIMRNADSWLSRFDLIPEELMDKAMEYTSLIAEKGAQFAGWFLALLLGYLTSFSTFMINFVLAIILAYFLSVEIETWKRVATEKTPKTFKSAFFFLKENVLKGIGTYLKAQLKLISITFAIIYVSLLLLGVESSFSIALLAAFFDVMPILGVSAVFIPWIIYLFFVGNSTLAIWLIVVLAIVTVMRQIMEPKITGDSLGVSAFTMLTFMIISLSLFGVAGLIISPILIILLKALYEQGYLARWIRLPKDEFDDKIEPTV